MSKVNEVDKVSLWNWYRSDCDARYHGTISEYPIPRLDEFSLVLSPTFTVLSVIVRNDQAYLVLLEDAHNNKVETWFQILSSGESVYFPKSNEMSYVGTLNYNLHTEVSRHLFIKDHK